MTAANNDRSSRALPGNDNDAKDSLSPDRELTSAELASVAGGKSKGPTPPPDDPIKKSP